MNNYEAFRAELSEKMLHESCLLTRAVVADVLKVLDRVARHYDITQNVKDLTVTDGALPPEVKQYIVACGIEGQSKGTLKGKQLVYELFFKEVHKPVCEITANDIRMYLFSYKQSRQVSDRTLDHYRTVLSSFFEWCVLNEFIAKNPLKQIKPIKYEKKQKEALTRLDLEVLRSSAKNDLEVALIDFIFSTGCRVSEVCNAKLGDINWSTRQIRTVGKGRKERVVYLNDRAFISLKKYLEKRKNQKSEFVFCSNRGECGPYTTGAIEKIIRNMEKRCELSEHVTPHVVRHTFATLAHKAGMPLEDIQVAMGHESIDTTRIYAEISEDEVRTNHAKFVV